MESLAKVCGAVAIGLGAFAFAAGLASLYKTWPAWMALGMFPYMLIGSGFGVFVSGVVVAALGEIISRLPPARTAGLVAHQDRGAPEF